QGIVGRHRHHARVGSDEPVKVLGIAGDEILVGPLAAQGFLNDAQPGRHVAGRAVGVVFHVAPLGVFVVQHELHPDRQRGQGHLDEITRVVDGLGEGSREHDELSTVLGRLVDRLPLGVSVDSSTPTVIPPGYAHSHLRRHLSSGWNFAPARMAAYITPYLWQLRTKITSSSHSGSRMTLEGPALQCYL